MTFRVEYHEEVVRVDIPKLSAPLKIRVREAIERKLTTEPEKFGKPLRRSLKNYRVLRVEDYRVVFRIEKRVVKIFIIQHRRDVYKKTVKRS